MRRSRRWLVAFVAALCCCGAAARPALGQAGAAADALETKLRARLDASPRDATAWRLLGRIRFERGDFDGALQALNRAVEYAPLSAAAHFDLGRTLVHLDRNSAAAAHLREVIELAPDSDYSTKANALLAELPPASEPNDGKIVQAGYEIRRFDGSSRSEAIERKNPAKPETFRRLRTRIETGVLYNSNVALTPISRELAPGTRESFQAFVAPELEWAAFDSGRWRGGPSFEGNFTLNEGNFESLNLQSYAPGAFVEHFVFTDSAAFVPRLQYRYTHDEFDGRTFGNRHGLLASLTAYRDDGHATFLYWAADHTDFANDGLAPDVTSRDGWLNAIGLSHEIPIERRWLRLFRAGLDLERADTVGSDFTYNGISLFGQVEVPLTAGFELVVDGGWGYRDYPDFESDPSRNENIWRAGAELRKRFTDSVSAAVVFDYDRFDSKNPLFAADRYVAGLVLRFDRYVAGSHLGRVTCDVADNR